MSKKRWIFCFKSKITDEEKDILMSEISLFLNSWKAHGASLTSSAKIHMQQVLEIIVDESEVSASGCSIDNMAKSIKSICQIKSIEFLDESSVPIMINNNFNEIKRSDIKNAILEQKIIPENLMIDFSGITVESEGTEDFIKEIKNSWVKAYL